MSQHLMKHLKTTVVTVAVQPAGPRSPVVKLAGYLVQEAAADRCRELLARSARRRWLSELHLRRRPKGNRCLSKAVNIIVRSKEGESVRRAKEYAEQTRKHYYGREQRDGSRFQSKAGTKEQIKKALE
jgi:hypothetical protein